jgi:dihydropteroate synthase
LAFAAVVERLDCNGRTLDLRKTAVMGVVNVTPDSFSDGGRFLSLEHALRQADTMVREGVAIIDVGGESTRPGAKAVSIDEELDRVIPVISAIAARFDVPVSIDSSKPDVMREAVSAGAGLINDVRALQAEGALAAAAALDAPICLMHMKGEPRTMQRNPQYGDIVADIKAFLCSRIDACVDAGIPSDHLFIDPGFGFGKTLQHNLELLRRLHEFGDMGVPILVGLSRKSMIGALLDQPVDRRLHGSLAVAVIAAWQGANVIRAHDVAATVEALRVHDAVRQEPDTS